MHFRERNQVVQIIRTKYDAATKKGKNEIVGRLTKANPKISDELKAALTPEERKEVAAWICRPRDRRTAETGAGRAHLAGTDDAGGTMVRGAKRR